MLRTVSELNQAAGRQATIVVEADDIETVMSAAARELALQTATSMGVSRAGISGNGGVYPVDAAGHVLREPTIPPGTVTRFRCDYNVTAGL